MFYLWFFLWWFPVDTWEKKRTSSSFLPQTGCLSSGSPSGGKRGRAPLERGAPFQTQPLLTCSFFWPVTRKIWTLSSSWHSQHLSNIAVSASSCCFHALLPLWRTSSPLRWVFPSRSTDRCRFSKEERVASNTAPVVSTTIVARYFICFQLQTATSWLAKWMLCFFCISGKVSFTRTDGKRAQGCGAQLACQNAMETFSAGIRLGTLQNHVQYELHFPRWKTFDSILLILLALHESVSCGFVSTCWYMVSTRLFAIRQKTGLWVLENYPVPPLWSCFILTFYSMFS